MTEPNDYGWAEFIDQAGKPCVYCGEPGVDTLIVRPLEGTSWQVKKRGHRVPVCRAHVREGEGPHPSYRFRNRKSPEGEQLRWDV